MSAVRAHALNSECPSIAGSFEAPGSAAAVSCPPAHLVAVGKTLQLQTSKAPTELQTPTFPVDKWYDAVAHLGSHVKQPRAYLHIPSAHTSQQGILWG